MGEFDTGGNEFLNNGGAATKKKNRRQYYRNRQPDAGTNQTVTVGDNAVTIPENMEILQSGQLVHISVNEMAVTAAEIGITAIGASADLLKYSIGSDFDHDDMSTEFTDGSFSFTKESAETVKKADTDVKSIQRRIVRNYYKKEQERYKKQQADYEKIQADNNGSGLFDDVKGDAFNNSDGVILNSGSTADEVNLYGEGSSSNEFIRDMQERKAAEGIRGFRKKKGENFKKSELKKNELKKKSLEKKAGKEAEREAKKQSMKEMQKARIKRYYQQSVMARQGIAASGRGAAAAGSAAADTTAKTVATTAGEVTAAEGAAASSAIPPWVLLIIAAVILLIFILIGIILYNAFVPVLMTVMSIGGSYQSEAEDIDAAEEALQYLEVNLKKDILNIETDYPDYDEYEYDPEDMADYIGHNPFTLINYLSALFVEFKASDPDVVAEIQSLFEAMYELKMEEKTETRVRYVVKEREMLDEDGNPVLDEDGEPVMEEYLEEEEYEVTILAVSLTRKTLEEVVAERLEGNENAKDLYEVYSETKGLRQCFEAPIDDWENKISSYYGYRIHPITGEIRFHNGIDIAVPEGTDVKSAQDGVVIFTGEDPGGYGYYMMVENDDGYKSLYAHLSGFYKSVGDTVSAGDVIAASGNTGGSTGPHLHLEVYYEGKRYNPIFYVG